MRRRLTHSARHPGPRLGGPATGRWASARYPLGAGDRRVRRRGCAGGSRRPRRRGRASIDTGRAAVGALFITMDIARRLSVRFEWDRPSWCPWTWRAYRRWLAPGQLVETDNHPSASVLDVDLRPTPYRREHLAVRPAPRRTGRPDRPALLPPLADTLPALVGRSPTRWTCAIGPPPTGTRSGRKAGPTRQASARVPASIVAGGRVGVSGAGSSHPRWWTRQARTTAPSPAAGRVVRRLPRAAAGWRRRRVRQVQPSRRRLHGGDPLPGCVTSV